MLMSFLIYIFVVTLSMKNEVLHAAADNTFKRYFTENQCFLENQIPRFKLDWDGFKIHVNQLLENGFGNSVNYFITSRGAQAYLSSSGVLCISTHNESSFSISYNGVFLGKPVEFKFSLSSSDLINKTKNEQSLNPSRIKGDKASLKDENFNYGWNLLFTSIEETLVKGAMVTDCSPFELFQSPSDLICRVETELIIPNLNIYWLVNGKIQRHKLWSRFSARLYGSNTYENPLKLEVKWNNSFQPNLTLSVEIPTKDSSFLSSKIYSTTSNDNSTWDLKVDIVSRKFDWQFRSNWTSTLNGNSREISSITEGNYLYQPVLEPIKYLFGFVDNQSPSRLVDIRHNISSALYWFEGNMTVDVDSQSGMTPAAVITQISQKVRTLVDKEIYVDLQQIFHKSGDWNWETVVMKSGLFNMHVNGLWNRSLLHLYEKRFQFNSIDEAYVPSFNIDISYADNLRFFHRITIPFMARSYDVVIELSNPNLLFPMVFKILFRDEFKTNYSQTIAQLELFNADKIINARATTDWPHLKFVYESVCYQFLKFFSWIKNEKHPINQLLQPVFRRPSVAQVYRDMLKWYGVS